MSHQSHPTPPDGPRRFSWGRVFSILFTLAIAGATIVAIYLFPGKTRPAFPTQSLTPEEQVEVMRRQAKIEAAKQRAERERVAKEAEKK